MKSKFFDFSGGLKCSWVGHHGRGEGTLVVDQLKLEVKGLQIVSDRIPVEFSGIDRYGVFRTETTLGKVYGKKVMWFRSPWAPTIYKDYAYDPDDDGMIDFENPEFVKLKHGMGLVIRKGRWIDRDQNIYAFSGQLEGKEIKS